MPSKGLLLTFGLTYGGGLVALFNPFIGLLIYVCFSIIRPEDMWFYEAEVTSRQRSEG